MHFQGSRRVHYDEILENTNCIETLAAKKGYKLKVRNPIDYIQQNGE
jgi:hypothetical protein